MSTFNLTQSDKYWDIIKSNNRLYNTAAQNHLKIMRMLQADGVKFEDIKRYLLNRAKRVGLYRQNHWSDKSKKMVYPPTGSLKHRVWYREMMKTVSWIRSNYVSYDRKNDAAVKALNKAKSNKEKTILTIKKDGNVVETRIEETTVGSSNMNDPVTSSMSNEEVMAIILQNLDVLGTLATAKGAKDEFNSLMEKMGESAHIIQ